MLEAGDPTQKARIRNVWEGSEACFSNTAVDSFSFLHWKKVRVMGHTSSER